MTQPSNTADQQPDADLTEPARLRAGDSNDYGTLPAVVPWEETVAEHPVPEPSGPVSGADPDGDDGDGD